MPVRPMRGGKVSGVLNNNDSSSNEMSYIDMHDLHPENVQAAQVAAATSGAIEGATLAAIPAAAVVLFGKERVVENGIEKLRFSTSALGFGALIVAAGAIVMSKIRSYAAKKDAETHNAWSDRVLSRMELREENEAARHAPPSAPHENYVEAVAAESKQASEERSI